jgi:hypothetical protein
VKASPGSVRSTALRFARAVAGRYGRLEARARIRLVCLARLRSTLARAAVVRRTTNVAINPRLALTLVERGAAVARTRTRQPEQQAVVLRLERGSRLAGPGRNEAVAPLMRHELVRLVERVVARGRRIDGRPRLEPAPGPAGVPVPLSTAFQPAGTPPAAAWRPPVPQVYATAGAPQTAPRAAIEDERSRGRALPPERLDLREPLGAAEPDITRLTDRVVEAIDRRIVARRERFGRP